MSDDIIRMAREAGVKFPFEPTESRGRVFAECWLDELERFAELVRADAIAKEREWVGLTDEDVMSLVPITGHRPATTFARNVEAKLKEKNHG